MKKLLNLLFLLFVSFGIVACSNTVTTQETTVNQTTEEVTTQMTTQETTVEPTTTMAPTTMAPTTTMTPTTTTESIELESFVITEQSDMFYDLSEVFDPSSIVLTASFSNGDDLIVDASLYQVRGFNSSTPGIKTAYITYDSLNVEYHYIVLEEWAFEIDMAYYEDAINLNGVALKLALHDIINENFIPLLYGDARYILDESDVDPNNPDNIILVYKQTSVPSIWDSGATWNREHVWPQSRLGVYVEYGDDDFPSKATDLHNLKPSDPDENASRSNDYFDYIDTSDTYTPPLETRGDIARILFYMATMYFDLTLNNDISTSSAFKTMGILDVLIEWNELDPVDDFERNRNEVIFANQGNRNPFIDYPEFVELIWGDNAGQ